jgi:hypothetical protein
MNPVWLLASVVSFDPHQIAVHNLVEHLRQKIIIIKIMLRLFPLKRQIFNIPTLNSHL